MHDAMRAAASQQDDPVRAWCLLNPVKRRDPRQQARREQQQLVSRTSVPHGRRHRRWPPVTESRRAVASVAALARSIIGCAAQRSRSSLN